MLERVDARPISFARRRDVRLRSGLELELPFGGRDGRVQLSASHSWLRKSEVQIRSDLAPVDQLSSEGTGDRREPAAPPTGIQRRLRVARSRLQAAWQPSQQELPQPRRCRGVQGAAILGADDLGLRAFIDGSRLLPDTAWMRGARFSLSVQNIGGSRERIEDKLRPNSARLSAGLSRPAGPNRCDRIPQHFLIHCREQA